ncbi:MULTISPECIES: sensor histidine kinase [unclassified Marinobacterium]|uniref:sensor histidine kinase n=1 Tax=unclassified Marinobacterium TaxID=2644139 RepID=UPI0015689288|nr:MULTISPECIES: response regulator [unclassified Marinobacterium]NRP09825.1 Sensor protein ZraS [Marinobacterium sp. xm-g-48]NRP14570.1 Sensor protein ZraS [Marinobacterium sp. xm-a-152]NRP36263.1 Sensor protein ZraS [Marinobacterium sp. xm-d-579]NRP82670.1 Sensor protein ZraS [Marinobacterium sp. xm-d-509]
MQLLIADDSPTFRAQLEFVARQIGHNPSVFETGDQLWEHIQSHGLTPSLLLLDWEMPGLSGPDLCEKIRLAYPHLAIHIILVTSRDETTSLVDGLSSGADDYVTKPINRDELAARLSVGQRNILLRQQLLTINEQRIAAEKLSSVAQLASGAAHEINNPLAFVRSNLDYVSSQTSLLSTLNELLNSSETSLPQLRDWFNRHHFSELIDELEEVSRESLQGVTRIQSIVEGLLRFNSEQGLQRQSVDLNSLLTQLLPKGATLSLPEALFVVADPKQLEKMFAAVIENAVLASQEVSTIRIQGRLVGGEIEISVKDSGVGISDEQRARAFDPFYTTRSIGSGLGLGLSLAQGIARQHNAELTLDSQLGIGTTVIYRCHAA